MKLLPSNSGFTLLEVLIAVAIMAVAFGSILELQFKSLDISAKARRTNMVAMLAKTKMVETENEIEGKSFDEFKKEDGGEFPDPYQEFSWHRTVKEVKFPSLNVGGAKQPDGSIDSQAEMLAKVITKYLTQTVREVTVTISWKRGTGEQSFSVATYWVDLNHEFTFSE